jgi:long-subunit fatty acid transport protein
VLSLALPRVLAAQEQTFGITLPRALNFTTSPSPVGSGARAAAQAFAFIAVADDATAASHNPAGLVQLETPEVSIVGSSFVRFEDQDVNQPETLVENQTLDSLNLNYLSVAFPFRLMKRTVVASLNFQRIVDFQGNTNTSTKFTIVDSDTGFTSGAGSHDVSSDQDGRLFTISPALAVQLAPTFSVGMAVNIWPALFDNGWEQDVSVRSSGLVFSGNRLVPFTSTGKIQEDFDFEGVNVTAGFLWTINSVFSLGGVVRSPFTASVTRTHRSTIEVTVQGDDGAAPVSSACNFRETLDMDMPWSYGMGLAARLTTRLRWAIDIARIHWSDFRLEASQNETTECNTLSVGTPVGKGQRVLSGASDDTTSVRMGVEYLWVHPKVVVPFRAGIFYDPEPGDEGTDDFFGFSLGTGLAIGSFVLDMAYTFRSGTVKSQAFDTSVYQHLVLASMIYHF